MRLPCPRKMGGLPGIGGGRMLGGHMRESQSGGASSDPIPPAAVSVALVEDNAGLRESLAVLLSGTPGFRCVGAFATAEAALKSMPGLKPDVALMDIHLPNLSGIGCV